MPFSMRFDVSGMKRAFERMEQTAQNRGKSLAKDQGGFFLRMAKRLGWQLAPSKEELLALKNEYGNRLRRKKGRTVDQEVARRVRARGAYAKSWMFDRIESNKYRIRIWIKNRTNYSGLLERQKHVAARAAAMVGGRFQEKLKRYAKQVTDAFKA